MGDIRRREFIRLLGGAAVAWPLAARAQEPKMPRIGYVWIGSRGTEVSYAGLRRGLEDRGYAVGRNLVLEERYADGHAERLPALIAELLAVKVDVLVTPGTPMTRVAQRATSTVPIVSVSGDPVGAGLVASLSRPGGNITGLSLLSSDYSAKWLGLLKEAVPKLYRVAVLWNTDNVTVARQIEKHAGSGAGDRTRTDGPLGAARRDRGDPHCNRHSKSRRPRRQQRSILGDHRAPAYCIRRRAGPARALWAQRLRSARWAHVVLG
jgi:ABC transporter substrate binding protein